MIEAIAIVQGNQRREGERSLRLMGGSGKSSGVEMHRAACAPASTSANHPFSLSTVFLAIDWQSVASIISDMTEID
jgi:hypothetical protein